VRAVVVEEIAEDFAGVALRDIETPAPLAGEVLVKVRAASVNFPDLLQTRGLYQHKPPLPFVGGGEAAGEVVEVGAGAPFKVGDAVVGSTRSMGFGGKGGRPGAFAEYAVVGEPRLKPEALSFAQAAAFGATYNTAMVSLVSRANLKAGEWLLVHGAGGGVGLACVDLAKALGARVIAASASDEKLAFIVKTYAPEHTINVSGGFREQVKEWTGGGADVIMDPVGGDIFDESVRCIGFAGRLLTVGYAGGRIPTLPVNLALIKGFSLIGVRAGEYVRQFPEEGRANLDRLWTMAAEGKLNPHVHAEFPLDRWREAYELLSTRKVIGKAVIRPDL